MPTAGRNTPVADLLDLALDDEDEKLSEMKMKMTTQTARMARHDDLETALDELDV